MSCLIPMGVGEAFTARHYTSCLALGVDDDWLLIDCPHPLRKMLREASIAAGLPEPLDIDRFDAAAVTHLHADHCCGLEDFGYYSFFALGRRAKLLMHPEASARLWDGLLAAGMEIVQARPDEPPVRKATGRLLRADRPGYVAAGRVRPVLDRVPADDPRRADLRAADHGRRARAAASAPTRPMTRPDRVALRRRPDRPRGDLDGPLGVHTPYEKLAALPGSLRSRMRLTHLPDDFDADSSAIEPLREGRVYDEVVNREVESSVRQGASGHFNTGTGPTNDLRSFSSTRLRPWIHGLLWIERVQLLRKPAESLFPSIRDEMRGSSPARRGAGEGEGLRIGGSTAPSIESKGTPPRVASSHRGGSDGACPPENPCVVEPGIGCSRDGSDP